MQQATLPNLKGLKVFFSDEHFMVLDKPAGLVVTQADSHHQVTLSEILKNEFKINLDRGGIVHRLDKDTSGLIIVAKSQNSLENLQLQFKERMVKKKYLALVHNFLGEEILVEGAISRNPQNREKFVVSLNGKEAKTNFIPQANYLLPENKFPEIFPSLNKNQKRKLENYNYGKFSLVLCLPYTGRTHQIRVHLKYINHPIVSDEKYAGRKISRFDKRFCPRQFLHAVEIEFYHPFSGQRLQFKSGLPSDLEQVLSLLEKN